MVLEKEPTPYLALYQKFFRKISWGVGENWANEVKDYQKIRIYL